MHRLRASGGALGNNFGAGGYSAEPNWKVSVRPVITSKTSTLAGHTDCVPVPPIGDKVTVGWTSILCPTLTDAAVADKSSEADCPPVRFTSLVVPSGLPFASSKDRVAAHGLGATENTVNLMI